jgi:hypothetical protein
MIRYIPLVFFLGCDESADHQRVEGDLHVSPKHEIAYYGLPEDGEGIDLAADLFLATQGPEAKYVIHSCTINVVAGKVVLGGEAWTMAMWYQGSWGWIDVARDSDWFYDVHTGLTLKGVSWLRHEWLHEFYQDGSHNRFPFH